MNTPDDSDFNLIYKEYQRKKKSKHYCKNCENMAKNLLYIEHELKDKLITGESFYPIIEYINCLNKNIAYVLSILKCPPYDYIEKEKSYEDQLKQFNVLNKICNSNLCPERKVAGENIAYNHEKPVKNLKNQMNKRANSACPLKYKMKNKEILTSEKNYTYLNNVSNNNTAKSALKKTKKRKSYSK